MEAKVVKVEFLLGLMMSVFGLVSLFNNAPKQKVVKVLVLNFDPVIETEGSKRLHEVFGWHDPK